MFCPACDQNTLEKEETEDDISFVCSNCGYDSH